MRDSFLKILKVLLIVFTLSSCQTTPVSFSKAPPEKLIIGLDGIGYSLFKEMHEGGHFRNFHSPSRMISTFPSISDPNWSRLFDVPVSESYTKVYFDQKRNQGRGKKVGNILYHLSHPPTHEKGFHFKAKGFWGHLVTMVWTETSALHWLDVLEEDFFNVADVKNYFALIANSDIISHVNGRHSILRYMKKIDDRLKAIEKKYRKLYGKELEIILISDHGNSFFKKIESIHYKSVLKDKGWSYQSQLKNKLDYTFISPEIISFGAFYCKNSQRFKLAKDLSYVEGVHITAIKGKLKNTVDVFSESGKNHSQIFIDPKRQRVGYKVIQGEDPFSHISLFKNTKLSWEDYFKRTVDLEYPYALVRLWESLYINSIQSAQVVVSGKAGYAFSNVALRIMLGFDGLHSTHGSLNRGDTTGLFVSNQRVLPSIRPEDFKKIVNIQDFHDVFHRNEKASK